MMSHALLADLVLLLHCAVVLFVVAGLPLIVGGNLAGWRWVNHWWFRVAHLLAICIVVGESWLGIACPLTTLEFWLREQGGEALQAESFIGHWMQRVLYYRVPEWVFVWVYTGFGVLVVGAWWCFPPGDGRGPGRRWYRR